MTIAAGPSISFRVDSVVSPKAFFTALDRASTPTTAPPWPRRGIDRNVAIRSCGQLVRVLDDAAAGLCHPQRHRGRRDRLPQVGRQPVGRPVEELLVVAR